MSERFTARAAVEYWASQHNVSVDKLGLGPIIVGSWDPRTVKSLAKTISAKRSPSWWWGPRFPLYNGLVGSREVSIVSLPLGAPAHVLVM